MYDRITVTRDHREIKNYKEASNQPLYLLNQALIFGAPFRETNDHKEQ